MIESEQKRKRLTESIERWCKHTNHINLRAGDIFGLVDSILEEFYHITLCCGHKVREFDEGVDISSEEYGGSYCKDCAKEIGEEKVEK